MYSVKRPVIYTVITIGSDPPLFLLEITTVNNPVKRTCENGVFTDPLIATVNRAVYEQG